jgi:uncharacterized protein (TIGR03437 family)
MRGVVTAALVAATVSVSAPAAHAVPPGTLQAGAFDNPPIIGFLGDLSVATLVQGPDGLLVAFGWDTPNVIPWAISRDGGTSWQQQPAVLPIGGRRSGSTTKPTAVYDPTTRSILVLAASTANNQLQLVRITFDGQGQPSVGAAVNPVPGLPSDHVATDMRMAVDPGDGTIYVVFVDVIAGTFNPNGGIFLNRSFDGGATWVNRGILVVSQERGNTPLGIAYTDPQVLVGRDHEVVVFYKNQQRDRASYVIQNKTSVDRGSSYPPAVTIVQPAGEFDVAVNPVTGALYLVYGWFADDGLGDPGDILFSESSNVGRSWTATVRVNDNVTGPKTDEDRPSLAVSGDGQFVAVTWYDQRTAGKQWRYATVGEVPPGGGPVSFRLPSKPNFALSGPGWSTPSRRLTVDFAAESVVAVDGVFVAIWCDERTNPVTMRSARFAPIVGSASMASAASYRTKVAPGSLAAVFGTRLANQTAYGTDTDPDAPGIQLPTSLAGTSVVVRDANGDERLAPLFFVSYGQVNVQVPVGTAPGPAYLFVRTDGPAAMGTADVAAVAPGLFSAASTGSGPASGYVLRVDAAGQQHYERIAHYDEGQQAFFTDPIRVSDPNEQVYLVLFGTGWRLAGGAGAAGLALGDTFVPVTYLGEQPDQVALDQLNTAALPTSLAGAGVVLVSLAVNGVPANLVVVEFA